MFNRGRIEVEFNSQNTWSGIEEFMLYMMRMDDDIDMNWWIIMREMGTILEIQEHVQSGMDWSWIQLSHHWIWIWGFNGLYYVIGWWYWYELMNNNERNVNNIGASGACSIGEGLKVNSTLKTLNLSLRI